MSRDPEAIAKPGRLFGPTGRVDDARAPLTTEQRRRLDPLFTLRQRLGARHRELLAQATHQVGETKLLSEAEARGIRWCLDELDRVIASVRRGDGR